MLDGTGVTDGVPVGVSVGLADGVSVGVTDGVSVGDTDGTPELLPFPLFPVSFAFVVNMTSL